MQFLHARRHRARLLAALAIALVAAALAAGAALASHQSATGDGYAVHNLVSDGFIPADHIDPLLVNGWGIAAGPSTPWWVAANGTDHSTIYTGDGTIVPFRVRVDGGPTGIVFNGGPNFVVHKGGNSGPAIFIFASEDGKIRGWNPNVPSSGSTQAVVATGRARAGAIYKGLAIASTASGDFLYAADFHNARVDIFDGNFNLVRPHGAFRDPALPEGYAPFGIQAIGDRIFVTYAKQDEEAEDEVAGPGRGFVDVYDTSGMLLGRVASRGPLNAPWGVALAPSSGFGQFSGDLLIGNFGDGKIHAYQEQANGTFVRVGALLSGGHPIVIDGLWGIGFGNGGPSGPTTSLYFASGPDDEQHGLYGVITAQ